MNGTALGRPPRWRHRGRRPLFVSSGYANWGPDGWWPYTEPVIVTPDPAASQPDPKIVEAQKRAETAERAAAQAAKSAKTLKWIALGAAGVALFALGRSGT